MAAERVCEEAGSALTRQVDLAMLFVSGEHAEHTSAMAEVVRRQLGPGTLVAVSAEGVLAQGQEAERRPAAALFAATLPGVSIHPFTYRQIPHIPDENDGEALVRVAQAVGARADLRATFFFADPYSIPAASAVQTIAAARLAVPGLVRLPVIGGMASSGTAPGGNILVLNGEVMRAGGIGLSIRGDVAIDTLVSQGCRPIGKPLIVTGAQRNVIKTLGGMRAMDALREIVTGLSEPERSLLPRGMFIGRVINEYKDRFGRGDFLIRGVMGADEKSGAIAVADGVRVGQTIQFHLRDAATASEDLRLLLDAQELLGPAAGGLLFTCNGRGKRLFEEPSHDAQAVSRAMAPDGSPFPLAGFFAAGEIGPIGNQSFVHGHTACLALLRPWRPPSITDV